MKKIPAKRFKARCLETIDEVAKNGTEIIITKDGKPIARILPFEAKKREDISSLKGTATHIGDVISPINVAWEAGKNKSEN